MPPQSTLARKKHFLWLLASISWGCSIACGLFLVSAVSSKAAITHRWSFSEASGTNVLDSIGSANGWVVVIGTNTDYSRISGQVRMSGGSRSQTDYVQFPSGLVSSLTNVTIEIWATPRAGQSWSRIFDFGSGSGVTANDFYLSFCRGGTSLNQQRMEYDPAPRWRIDTGVATTASNQYHYVATWSATGGTGGGGRAAWYRDGALIGSTDTGIYTISNVNDTVLWLGRSQFTADNSASADYNELRIYSHAMVSNEVNFSRSNGPDTLVFPPNQASALTINTNPNVLVLSWTPGAGSAGSVVVMRAGQPTSMQPNYGNTYTGSPIFGNGSNLGGSNFVVYAGSGSGVTVTNLTPGVRYYAAVYSYSGSGASTIYNLGDPPTADQVAPGIVQSVTLQVNSLIPIETSAQATVLANYVGGSILDVTTSATYASSATNVVTVSSNGLLQALTYGSALIMVSYQGKQDSNTVTVVNPLTNNLMHRYNFAGDASDLVGGAHGTLQGGATIVGSEAVLDGASGYVELPPNLISNYTALTMEMWVTDFGSGTWARLFDFGSGTTRNMFLGYSSGTALRAAFTINGAGAEQRVTGPRPPPGTQTHVVLTTDGATPLGKLYTNGVLVASNVAMSLRPVDIGTTPNDWLGRSQYPDPYLNGAIDEFRIYNAALSASIILTNFHNGPDGISIAPPNAVDDMMTLNPGAKALIPVVQNDQAVQINPDSVTIISGPISGTAQAKPGGKVLYTHNGGPSTSDQFTYTVQNTGGTSDVATVFLTISPALRLPNTTMTIPNTPPPVGYQTVDAFPNNPFFEDALALSSPPGSSNLLFVAERRGIISYVDVTQTNPVRQVFLDIRDQCVFDGGGEGEMGLLGFDFHPGFATNGYVFVAYMAPGGSPYFDRLVRFTANPIALTVDTNTQQILFSVIDQVFNHNGSDVHFGPDGYLYMSMGDEGDQYNARQNAQRIDRDFYSGLLRIDVDRKPGNVEPNPHTAIATNGSGQAFYKIPIDNPYVHTSLGGTWNGTYFGETLTNLSAVRGEFFATGLRHVWRFWIDPLTSEVWAGDVGQDRFEEINIVTNGGNYGWPYYEGTTLARSLYPGQVNLPTNPPPGLAFGLHTYGHTGQPGDPLLAGNAVIGGVVYRGNRLPEVNGAYVFGDFPVGGASTIWTLRRTNSSVVVQRIASDQGIAAFGIDPSNGDVLNAAYGQNRVKRLVRGDVASTFPQKLSDTGVFADLATLSPNPGIVSYDPTIAFWSDHAIKRRWFAIPDLTNKVTFATDANWSLPTGMKWIKHFDLPLDRNNTNSPRRRLETRILVKTDSGNYGVSYKWNDAQDEAFLVADSGDTFFVAITNGTPTNQLWEIPSRGSCLACHTAVGGHALTFHTREMNNVANLNGIVGNQIDVLSQAGYFSGAVPSAHMLPVYAKSGDTNASLEFRARSYLAINCVQCHQPGGTAPSTWDARPYLTLAQTGLINTTPVEDGGNPLNKIIVPGDLPHSVLWQRIQGVNGFGRMPPLATHELDSAAINLLAQWISSELTNHLTFAQWQVLHFGSTNSPNALATADPDNDRASNYIEYLTQTNPQNGQTVWRLGIAANAGQVQVSYQRVPNLGVIIETSSNLQNWTQWNVSGNQPFFGSSSALVTLSGPLSAGQYFRARFVEP